MSQDNWKADGNICIICFILFLRLNLGHTFCTFPKSLTLVGQWSSHVTLYGSNVGSTYSFSDHEMNVSFKKGKTSISRYMCHDTISENTYILKQEEPAKNYTYKCVKFDQWSSNVVQLYESNLTKNFRDDMCNEENMKAGQWPLVMRYLDYGYVGCPDLGGYDMDVLDETGYSFCQDYSRGRMSRFESECVYGEGIQIEFPLMFCKGDMPLAKSVQFYCLGHKKIANNTHVVVSTSQGWTKMFAIKIYPENNEKRLMYISEDIKLNLTTSERGKTWEVILTRKRFPTLCENEYNSCSGSTCTNYNKLHCMATCRNHTTCLSDKPYCTFEKATRGKWIDQSQTGNRLIEIKNDTIYIDEFEQFHCLDIYSSTSYGPKPLVKTFNNGCKPRYACLDIKYFTTGIIRYRLSQTINWPYRENMVRGDLCNEENFRDDPFPARSSYRNQYYKILVQASNFNTKSERRMTVRCNLPNLFTFTVEISGQKCSGSLNRCELGDKMVMTFNSECKVPQHRVFYNCLAEYHAFSHNFIITEREDDESELNCMVFREDVIGNRRSYFLLLKSGDCDNKTRISLDGHNGEIPYLLSFNYTSVSNNLRPDSCDDIPLVATKTKSNGISTTNSETIKVSNEDFTSQSTVIVDPKDTTTEKLGLEENESSLKLEKEDFTTQNPATEEVTFHHRNTSSKILITDSVTVGTSEPLDLTQSTYAEETTINDDKETTTDNAESTHSFTTTQMASETNIRYNPTQEPETSVGFDIKSTSQDTTLESKLSPTPPSIHSSSTEPQSTNSLSLSNTKQQSTSTAITNSENPTSTSSTENILSSSPTNSGSSHHATSITTSPMTDSNDDASTRNPTLESSSLSLSSSTSQSNSDHSFTTNSLKITSSDTQERKSIKPTKEILTTGTTQVSVKEDKKDHKSIDVLSVTTSTSTTTSITTKTLSTASTTASSTSSITTSNDDNQTTKQINVTSSKETSTKESSEEKEEARVLGTSIKGVTKSKIENDSSESEDSDIKVDEDLHSILRKLPKPDPTRTVNEIKKAPPEKANALIPEQVVSSATIASISKHAIIIFSTYISIHNLILGWLHG